MSHSLTHTAVWLTLAAGLALAARQGDPKPPQKLLPSDRPVTKAVVVTDARQTYDIEFKGAVDGVMTRMPISYAAYHQGFQPNVFCRLAR